MDRRLKAKELLMIDVSLIPKDFKPEWIYFINQMLDAKLKNYSKKHKTLK